MPRYMQLHAGPLTAHKGYELIAFSFRVNGVSAPDGLVQGECGRVESITYDDGPGEFTVQLAKPYPRQLIAPMSSLDSAHATTIEEVQYVRDSYSATTGQLKLRSLTDGGAGAWTAGAAVTDNGVVHFTGYGQTVDQFVESAG